MSKRHKKTCRNYNCLDNSLLSISAVSGSVSISAFTSLAGVPVGIASSAVE